MLQYATISYHNLLYFCTIFYYFLLLVAVWARVRSSGEPSSAESDAGGHASGQACPHAPDSAQAAAQQGL